MQFDCAKGRFNRPSFTLLFSPLYSSQLLVSFVVSGASGLRALGRRRCVARTTGSAQKKTCTRALNEFLSKNKLKFNKEKRNEVKAGRQFQAGSGSRQDMQDMMGNRQRETGREGEKETDRLALT